MKESARVAKRRKQSLAELTFMAVVLTLPLVMAPTCAFADGIQSAAANLFLYVRGLGALFIGIGMAWGFIKLGIMHDSRDLNKIGWCLFSGLGLLLTPTILSVLGSLVGGSSTITSW